MTNVDPVLETKGLTIHFGGHIAVNNVDCRFEAGTLTAIVGPNGAGKTTYFNLISGQLRATAGSVHLFGEDITRDGAAERAQKGIGRAFQLTNLFPNLTVMENVQLAVQARAGGAMSLFRLAVRQRRINEMAAHYLERTALLDQADLIAAALPHGDQRKLEVAILLALEPEVFMFDEPTAGMSVDEVPVILNLIQEIKDHTDKVVMLVEHKMDVVRSLADRIIVLHNGYLVADGTPSEVIASPIVQEAYLGMGASDHV